VLDRSHFFMKIKIVNLTGLKTLLCFLRKNKILLFTNHMSMIKTSLTIIPMCPWERFPSYKSLSRLVLYYKKDWVILLHFIYFCYLLLVTNYPITKLSVTYNFSACREHLTENCLSFLSAPRWVRHSYLLRVLR
jgi:hypothetical protein